MDKNESKKPAQSGWKILFKHLLSYRKDIIILSVLGVTSALANASVPFLVGKFLDALTSSTEITVLSRALPLWLAILGVWLVVQFIANIIDWKHNLRSRYVGTHSETSYITRGVVHLVNLPLSFHKENKQGEVWDRLARTNNQLRNIIQNIIINLSPQFLAVVVGIAIAYTINVVLASILAGGVILYMLLLRKILKPLADAQRKTQEIWGESYGIAWDALNNYQTVKQSTAEEYEEEKIKKSFTERVFQSALKVHKIWANISFSQRMLILLTQLSIFVVSVFYVQNGTITIGDLVALNGYAAMVFGPFVIVANNWQSLQNGIISIERSNEILELEEENSLLDGKTRLKDVRGDIAFKDVCFSYNDDKQDVLKGINFSVNKGEVVAFVGESGVGKSTTIELLSGYYFPQKGSVKIDGVDTKDVDLYSLRKYIAVVPQEPVLFNDTIGTNIKYGNFSATDEEIKQAAKKAHADIFIEKFPDKYNQLVGERGVKLSVGQKQRIAIARAMLRDPKILILDEPTSALDPKTEQFIQESLEELMKGRTTFIIAHRLSTVRRADRIFVFDKGQIVEEGTHNELIKIKDGVYKRLHDLHIGLA